VPTRPDNYPYFLCVCVSAISLSTPLIDSHFRVLFSSSKFLQSSHDGFPYGFLCAPSPTLIKKIDWGPKKKKPVISEKKKNDVRPTEDNLLFSLPELDW
jgi:hypothetical protein